MVKETPDEPSPAKRPKGRLVGKRRKPKSPLRLVDEPSDEGVLVEEPAYNEEEANIQRALELSLHDQGKRTQGPATSILGQAGPNLSNQDEGQAGPSPGDQDEDQARSNPGDAAESQPQSSHVVPAGPNLEHMDLEATDASTQQKPNSSGTLSSLQNLEKDLSFTNQFFVEKPREEEPGKSNAEAEVQLMVLVPIHQDTSSVPPMTTLKSLELDYSNQRLADQEEARKKRRKRHDVPRTPSRSLPLQPPPLPPLASVSGAPVGVSKAQELSPIDSLMDKDSIPDEQVHLSDDEDFGNDHLPKADSRKDWWKPLLEEERPATLELAWIIPSSNVHDDFHVVVLPKMNKIELTQVDFEGQAYEIVKAFYSDVIHLQFQMEECHKMLTDQGSSPALSISKMKAARYPDFGLELSSILTDMILRRAEKKSEHICGFSVSSELKPTQDKDHLDHLPGSDKRMLSTDVKLWTRNLVIRYDGTLTRILEALDYRVKEFKVMRLNPEGSTGTWNALLVDVFVILTTGFFRERNDIVIPFKRDLPTIDMKEILQQRMFEDNTYKTHEVHNNLYEALQKCPSPSVPDGGVSQDAHRSDLEYLRYGSKGSSLALSISKMMAARYPDFGLELLVSEHMWIDDVCTYGISATYGISHWWFNRQKFYIDRRDSPSRRKEVRTHMRILTVIRVKAYSRYGDFEDLNLLLLQGHLDHRPGSDKHMLSTAVKLWT
ncbi:retrovirus-related pol polyprotein from transposon TNT 1-94 [Tanacetum coccineum]